MFKKSLATVTVFFTIIVFGPVAFAQSNDPITVLNKEDMALRQISRQINWDAKALDAAKSAQDYLTKKLQAELDAQKKLGARTVFTQDQSMDKSLVTNTPDHQKFVGTDGAMKYTITGNDGKNAATRTSKLFPEGSDYLSSYLVQLEKWNCKVTWEIVFSFQSWFIPDCKIVSSGGPDEFLRLALRSYLDIQKHNTFQDAENAANKVRRCLKGNYRYTIKDGVLDCPGIAYAFKGVHQIKLKVVRDDGGYVFEVDQNTNTATLRYVRPNYKKLATYAKWKTNTPYITFDAPN